MCACQKRKRGGWNETHEKSLHSMYNLSPTHSTSCWHSNPFLLPLMLRQRWSIWFAVLPVAVATRHPILLLCPPFASILLPTHFNVPTIIHSKAIYPFTLLSYSLPASIHCSISAWSLLTSFSFHSFLLFQLRLYWARGLIGMRSYQCRKWKKLSKHP